MKTMAQDMKLCLFPFDKFAVEPDITVTKVEGDHGHWALHLCFGGLVAARRRAFTFAELLAVPHASVQRSGLTGSNAPEICQQG